MLILPLDQDLTKHSIAGNEDSYRATFAYLFDDRTLKIKTSYGNYKINH